MSWVQYDRNGDVIEIVVKDCSGRKVDSFKFNGSDSRAFRKVLKILKDVYGFAPREYTPEIPYGESINNLE